MNTAPSYESGLHGTGALRQWLGRISQWNEALNARFFGKRPNGTQVYKDLVWEACEQTDSILHLGSGWDRTSVFDGKVGQERTVWALDPDLPSLGQNASPYRIVGVGEDLPLRDNCVDLIASEYVFEHIQNPLKVVEECARVLKPGGKLIVVTPNATSYFGLASKLSPFWFHVWYLACLMNKPARDTFPTYYRFNTRKQVKQISRVTGLRVSYLETIVGPPIYTTPLPVLHLLFIGIHKLLELPPLRRWGMRLVVVLEKAPGDKQSIPAATGLPRVSASPSPVPR